MPDQDAPCGTSPGGTEKRCQIGGSLRLSVVKVNRRTPHNDGVTGPWPFGRPTVLYDLEIIVTASMFNTNKRHVMNRDRSNPHNPSTSSASVFPLRVKIFPTPQLAVTVIRITQTVKKAQTAKDPTETTNDNEFWINHTITETDI
ncbi:hypothetical protein F2P81_019025 [Scophthalmus maximus]|uniref:Uncharacterized protein n=1 Tax=Scophthalmus maximus TaxID=52904 RepID=A0A6A4SDQ6_SCOMX|nr:hypothetical protein F2P81_019025 [Scophthalmus maximus]